MFRIKQVFMFLLLGSQFLRGQDGKDFRYHDSLTYKLYTDKSWKELISAGKNALHDGHDYYYLRMRIGIAYYEGGNYASASHHFRKAGEFSFNDQVVSEYLFYCYYLSGQEYLAWSAVSSTFPETRKRVLDESDFKKNNITVETFYSNSLTEDLLSNPGDLFGISPDGSQSISRYFLNNAIYASHIAGKGFAYFHSFSNLIKNSYLHYVSNGLVAEMPEQQLVQNQYYGAFNFFSRKGWTLTPAFHLILSSYPYLTGSGSGMGSQILSGQANDFSYVASMRLLKTGGWITIGAEGGFSELNSYRQAQAGASAMIYPLGNSNLYLGTSVSAVYSFEDQSSDLPLVWNFSLGFSIASKVWFDFSGVEGNTYNYTGNNGLLVYNSPDVLTRKVTGRILVPAGRSGLTFFAGGGRAWYVSKWYDEEGISGYTNNIEYFSNNITGGVSWNF